MISRGGLDQASVRTPVCMTLREQTEQIRWGRNLGLLGHSKVESPKPGINWGHWQNHKEVSVAWREPQKSRLGRVG